MRDEFLIESERQGCAYSLFLSILSIGIIKSGTIQWEMRAMKNTDMHF